MTQTKAELLQTRHQGDIRLGDADSTHYVGFKAPATVGTSLVWTLPATDGTAGYYLKTDGSGNLGWSLDNSGVSLSGSTNNTIATVTGANALQGEANLTFDGTNLKVNSSDGGSYHTIRLNTTTNNAIKDVLHVHSSVDSATAAAGYGVRLNFSGEQSNGNEYTFGGIAGLYVDGGANNGQLAFYTNNSGTNTERMRIDSSGRLLIGTTTEGMANANNLTIGSSASAGMTLRSGTSNSGNIYFSDATSGAGEYAGYIEYAHSNNSLKLATSGTLALTLDSSQNATFAGGISLSATTQNTHLGLLATSTAINFSLGSTSGTSPRMYFYGTGNGQSSAGDIFVGTGTGGIIHFRSAESIKFEVDSDNTTVEALSIAANKNATFAGRLNISHDLTITGTAPRLILTDSNNDSDFRINVDGGSFQIQDSTNSYANRLAIDSSGNTTFGGTVTTAGIDIDGQYQQAVDAITPATTPTVNCALGNFFTLNAASTYPSSGWSFTNVPASCVYSVIIKVTTGGSTTINWNSVAVNGGSASNKIKWSGGAVPAFTAGSPLYIILTTTDTGATWEGTSLIDFATV